MLRGWNIGTVFPCMKLKKRNLWSVIIACFKTDSNKGKAETLQYLLWWKTNRRVWFHYTSKWKRWSFSGKEKENKNPIWVACRFIQKSFYKYTAYLQIAWERTHHSAMFWSDGDYKVHRWPISCSRNLNQTIAGKKLKTKTESEPSNFLENGGAYEIVTFVTMPVMPAAFWNCRVELANEMKLNA